VTTGQQVPRKIIVRGKKPFKIVEMKSDADCFEFKTDDKASDRHVVEVLFAPTQDPGKVKETIHIVTDLGDTYDATLTAYATIVPETTEATPTGESKDVVSAPSDPGAAAASDKASAVAAQ
jgi:hypothetical protein